MSASGYIATDSGTVFDGGQIDVDGISFDIGNVVKSIPGLNLSNVTGSLTGGTGIDTTTKSDAEIFGSVTPDTGLTFPEGYISPMAQAEAQMGLGARTETGFAKMISDALKDNPKLAQAGLLALAGGAQGLLGASAKDKEIKAAKEMLETKEQQAIAAEQRLAQRAAYGKVGKESFGYKDTGLLATAMKEKK